LLTAAGVFTTPNRLNGLYDLFIQQLWINIGTFPGKFTSFYRAGRRLAQTAGKAAGRLMGVGNEITVAAVTARQFKHAALNKSDQRPGASQRQ